MSDIEDLFPSAAAADGEWQPDLPAGIKFVALVEEAEEIKDRLFVTDLSAQLEQVLAAARKRSRLHRRELGRIRAKQGRGQRQWSKLLS